MTDLNERRRRAFSKLKKCLQAEIDDRHAKPAIVVTFLLIAIALLLLAALFGGVS
jgi:hypothetical protein